MTKLSATGRALRVVPVGGDYVAIPHHEAGTVLILASCRHSTRHLLARISSSEGTTGRSSKSARRARRAGSGWTWGSAQVRMAAGPARVLGWRRRWSFRCGRVAARGAGAGVGTPNGGRRRFATLGSHPPERGAARARQQQTHAQTDPPPLTTARGNAAWPPLLHPAPESLVVPGWQRVSAVLAGSHGQRAQPPGPSRCGRMRSVATRGREVPRKRSCPSAAVTARVAGVRCSGGR